jgi:hypothetical protein
MNGDRYLPAELAEPLLAEVDEVARMLHRLCLKVEAEKA